MFVKGLEICFKLVLRIDMKMRFQRFLLILDLLDETYLRYLKDIINWQKGTKKILHNTKILITNSTKI